MYFKHNADNSIEINGVMIDYETFVRVEQKYKKELGISRISYTPGDHHIVWTESGNQIGKPFPWEDGDRYISRLADFKEMQKIVDEENRKEEKELLQSYLESTDKKQKETPQYPDIQELTVALWEMIVEGKDDSDINEIQKRRELVKKWKKKQNAKNR